MVSWFASPLTFCHCVAYALSRRRCPVGSSLTPRNSLWSPFWLRSRCVAADPKRLLKRRGGVCYHFCCWCFNSGKRCNCKVSPSRKLCFHAHFKFTVLLLAMSLRQFMCVFFVFLLFMLLIERYARDPIHFAASKAAFFQQLL